MVQDNVRQIRMELDTLKENNCYEMGQDYTVWDTGDLNDNMGQGVWSMEATGIFENWAMVCLKDGRQEMCRIDPGQCWSWSC